MFAVGFGSENREQKILQYIEDDDHTTAVILAAVHFEWMIKRSILKLGTRPTKALREELEDVYRIRDRGKDLGYKSIWKREVQARFSNAALGTVLGNLTEISNTAMTVRGKVVHGNGTVKRADARQAVEAFIRAGQKLRIFAAQHGEDLDSKLKARIKARKLA